MMTHFWTYTLADGRRALVDGASRRSYYDMFSGFGCVVAILPA